MRQAGIDRNARAIREGDGFSLPGLRSDGKPSHPSRSRKGRAASPIAGGEWRRCEGAGAQVGSSAGVQDDRRLVNVVLDEPQGFTNSVGQHWEVTNPELAVVRLHGRNAETWNIKGATAASDRFNYDYSDTELQELAGPILQLALAAMFIHVIFNNNNEDQGQRNARTLMSMLRV